MKKVKFQKQLCGVITLGLFFIVGCSYLSSNKDDTAEEKTTTPDTVSEGILGELSLALNAALPAAVPSAVPAALPALKAKIKHAEESDDAPNLEGLDEVEIDSIVEGARKAIADAGLADSEDLAAFLPIMIDGASLGTGDLALDSDVATSVLEVTADSMLQSIGARPEYLANSSGSSDFTDPLENICNQISSKFVSGLNNAGVDVSKVPDSAGALVNKLVSNLGKGVSDKAKLPGLLNAIPNGAMRGLDNIGKNIDSTILSNAIGKISESAAKALPKIGIVGFSESDLPALSQYMSEGITSSLSKFSNNSLSNAQIGEYAGMAVAGMMGGFSDSKFQSKFPNMNLSNINDISSTMTQAAVGILGSYNMNATEMGSAANKIMEQAVGAMDYFSSRPDYNLQAMSGKIMESGVSAVARIAAAKPEFDVSNVSTITGEIMNGGVKGTNKWSSFDITKYADVVGNMSNKGVAALGNVVGSNVHLKVDNLSAMISNFSNSSIQSVNKIERVGFNTSYLGEMTSKISNGVASGISNVSIADFEVNSDYINSWVQNASSGATRGLSGITMSGYDGATAASLASKVTEGTTGALDILGTRYGNAIINKDNLVGFISAGAAQGSTFITAAYSSISASDLAARVYSGITTGASNLGNYVPPSNLQTTVDRYVSTSYTDAGYSNNIAPPPSSPPPPPPSDSGSSGSSSSGSSGGTAPVVSSILPVSGASNVEINTSIVVNFSVQMDMASLNSTNISVYETSNSQNHVSVNLSATSDRLTITRASGSFMNSTKYTVDLNGLKSSSAVALAPYSMNFTTVASNSESGSSFVIQSTPTNGAAGVSKQSPMIKITFSAGVYPPSVIASNFYLMHPNNGVVTVTRNVTSSYAELMPSNPLMGNITYTLVIGSGISKEGDPSKQITAQNITFTTAP